MLTLFSKEKIGNKKTIENLVLFLILFIIVIVVMNTLVKPEEKVEQATNNPISAIVKDESEQTLEKKLENILSLINGAGKVNVLITYANGVEQVPMYNLKQNTVTTQEMDKAGGTRKTEEVSEEQSIIFNENGSEKTPVIKQTITPKIIGVMVVADGAQNMNVKEDLIKAVESILDVSSHRVQVFARQK